MNAVLLLFPLLTCLLNTIAVHTLLTRKRSIKYCLVAFIFNSIFVFTAEFSIFTNIHNPFIAKYLFFFIGFLYIFYIYFVFSESISKKLFAMFSIWIFSVSILLISMTLLGVLSVFTEGSYISAIIHTVRICLNILLLSVLYFRLGRPYKQILELVPDRTISFMSLYPITAFVLLINQSPDTIGYFEELNSIFDVLLLVYFIILGYLIVFAGISASSRLEVQKYMANFDSLTGIPNRANAMHRLTKTIEAAKRSKHKFALLLFDLDGFKNINDKYGHLTGDKTLKHVTQVVQRVLRSTDFIGRYGGDEFIIIQQFIKDEKDVTVLIDRIFGELSVPLVIDDYELQISISVGIRIISDDTSATELLIHQADNAMYEAKKTEGCAYIIFKP